jgi:hypothetical protein
MIPLDVSTLALQDEFLSPAEEQTLLAHIEAGIPTGHTRRHAKTRNVIQRWGSSVPYPNDILSDTIPEHFQFLLDRLVAIGRVPGSSCNRLRSRIRGGLGVRAGFVDAGINV